MSLRHLYKSSQKFFYLLEEAILWAIYYPPFFTDNNFSGIIISMITVTKQCEICRKEFSYISYPSIEQRKPKRRTCSKVCEYALKSKTLKGRYIKVPQNSKDLSKWTEFMCLYCNTLFIANIHSNRKFCSIKCKGLWQSENNKRENNPNWKPLKERINVNKMVRRMLIEEMKSCEICGISDQLQIHHKDKNRKNNDRKNLMVLCINCHSDEHKNMGDINAARIILCHKKYKDRKKTERKICLWCKKEYIPNNKNQKHCSPSCQMKTRYNSSPMERICPICNNTFTRKRTTSIYCSQKCFNKHITKRTKQFCGICGNEITNIKGTKPRKFCSIKCLRTHQKRSKNEEI
jgi:hypothetical protein